MKKHPNGKLCACLFQREAWTKSLLGEEQKFSQKGVVLVFPFKSPGPRLAGGEGGGLRALTGAKRHEFGGTEDANCFCRMRVLI